MLRRTLYLAGAAGILAAVIGGAVWSSLRWQAGQIANETAEPARAAGRSERQLSVTLSPQARKNLKLAAKPLKATTYWRVIELPGVVVDRPGISDRGVVSPIAGTVLQIHAFPGTTVAPEAPLFTIRLVSESLHASQLELFKAAREIEIAQRQHKRLSNLVQSGALAQARLIEIENLIDRTQATVDAYRQDLLSRGLSAERIDAAAKGEFVTELIVRAPGERALAASPAARDSQEEAGPRLPFSFEVQSLNIELGQQVEAGEVLCHLADHRALFIEGRAFQDDMPRIQEAARHGWEIEVELDEPRAERWPEFPRAFQIDHLSNTISAETRTFAFYLPLENQWQTYTQGGATRLLWRCRPGSRVRLRVAVDKLENVLVVPREGVVREGPEAYVFRQHDDHFEPVAVHVLHEDRRFAVLANDGGIRPGWSIAQGGAASLLRVLRAQAAAGLPADEQGHGHGHDHSHDHGHGAH